jgi:methyltransferase-like protein
LSAEIKDEIKIEYGLLERANLLWKALEQMYGSSNDKRLSSNVLENISSSSIHTDQDSEEQSSVQKEEKVKSVSLRKLDGLVS